MGQAGCKGALPVPLRLQDQEVRHCQEQEGGPALTGCCRSPSWTYLVVWSSLGVLGRGQGQLGLQRASGAWELVVWAPGVPCDWGLGLASEGALLVPVGVRVGAKGRGGLDSPPAQGGDEMRQGFLGPFISQASSVVSSFLTGLGPQR